MADVVGGVGGVHPGDAVADRDALIQRGEHAEPHALPPGWRRSGSEGGNHASLIWELCHVSGRRRARGDRSGGGNHALIWDVELGNLCWGPWPNTPPPPRRTNP